MARIFDREREPGKTTVVEIENDFDFLSDEYRALYDSCDVTGFQQPLWLHNIYKVLAPGVGAAPLIVTARKNGVLKALLPFVSQEVTGITLVQAADLGVSDYNRFIATPETLEELASDDAATAALANHVSFADILFLRKVGRDEGMLDRLFGRTTRSRCENSAYIIDLKPGAFETWRNENLKKGFRKNIDRRRRKLEGEFRDVFWKRFSKPEEIRSAMNFIREHRAKRFDGDLLAQDAYFEFYLACALAGAKNLDTEMSGIVVDGKLVSADFGVMGKGCLHSVLCAADIENFGIYAPGLQSLHDLIWERSEKGDSHFDVGIGNSRYKADFSAREVPLDNLSVSLSVKGQAVAAVYHRSKPLKNLLRNIVKKVH